MDLIILRPGYIRPSLEFNQVCGDASKARADGVKGVKNLAEGIEAILVVDDCSDLDQLAHGLEGLCLNIGEDLVSSAVLNEEATRLLSKAVEAACFTVAVSEIVDALGSSED